MATLLTIMDGVGSDEEEHEVLRFTLHMRPGMKGEMGS